MGGKQMKNDLEYIGVDGKSYTPEQVWCIYALDENGIWQDGDISHSESNAKRIAAMMLINFAWVKDTKIVLEPVE